MWSKMINGKRPRVLPLLLALTIRLYRHYHSLDLDKIYELAAKEDQNER